MATGWNVMDALNNKDEGGASRRTIKTKARFRTKDIAIKQM